MKNIIISLLALFAVTKLHGQVFPGLQIDDHLVSAIHSGGCPTQYLLGPPDNTSMVNMVDNSFIAGNFSSAWPDRSGPDLIFENSYTTGDCAIRLLLTDGTFSQDHVVAATDFDTLTHVNWTFVAVPSCVTQFLFGNSQRKFVALDFVEHFALDPTDMVVGVHIDILPGFNTDPSGVYIVSDLSTGITAERMEIDRPQGMLVSELLSIPDLKPGTEVLIHDQMGRVIHSGTVTSESFLLNMGSWSNGVYIARISNGPEMSVIRLMKVGL